MISREVRKGEKSVTLPSADNRVTGYHSKGRVLNRHDLVVLGLVEHDYSGVRYYV